MPKFRHKFLCIKRITSCEDSVKSSKSNSLPKCSLSALMAHSSVLYTNWLASEKSAASITFLPFAKDNISINSIKLKPKSALIEVGFLR